MHVLNANKTILITIVIKQKTNVPNHVHLGTLCSKNYQECANILAENFS